MTMASCTRLAASWIIGAAMMAGSTGTALAQVDPATATGRSTDEIVVTAQRSGIPVWRVSGRGTSVVLVGSIGRLVPGTQWNPVALDAALAQADRIMFPEAMDISFGLFSMISLIGKWRAQSTLPKGQTLEAMTSPAQWAQLVALRHRGILKPGFERKHPYHLAVDLGRSLHERRKLVPGADAYVRRYLGKNKDKRVPLAQAGIKEVTAEFFASSPREHVPCLMDVVALVEAGDAGAQSRAAARVARSGAWAARRVPAALAAKVDDGQQRCWPHGGSLERKRDAALGPALWGLLGRPQVTLAVVSLDALAAPGGVLDDLVAAGFDVSGPRWRP
ncbi:TraB/GumN family protein [Sphingomonas rubra]|uniref:TraB family protein n=1 Tax=Sphingomonas rubra TaxID=634430 RepID=A0A1I5TBY3_9SPHN|nr:TraB/GumN family protein [Sphingomonas rubra]SFP80540.1 TraB family protein [Sphingomonas rubra]